MLYFAIRLTLRYYFPPATGAATLDAVWWCGAGAVSYFYCEAYGDQCSLARDQLMFNRLIRPLIFGALANRAQLVRLGLLNLSYFQFTDRRIASQKQPITYLSRRGL